MHKPKNRHRLGIEEAFGIKKYKPLVEDILIKQSRERLLLFYVLCCWHPENREVWRNRKTGEEAPWVGEKFKNQKNSHGMCLPCSQKTITDLMERKTRGLDNKFNH
jgi:hypothetical protein